MAQLTIHRYKKYFQKLTLAKMNVNTIFDSANAIEGSRRSQLLLPIGEKMNIDNVLYSS